MVKYLPCGNDDTTIKVKWRENEKEQANPKGGDVMFGEFVKERRIARDVSLRKFCQTINWDALFKLPLTDSHKTGLVWAHCIWKNEIPSGTNPFMLASSMDAEMKKAILEAVKFCWSSQA